MLVGAWVALPASASGRVPVPMQEHLWAHGLRWLQRLLNDRDDRLCASALSVAATIASSKATSQGIGPICKAPNRLGKLSIMGSLWPIPLHTCQDFGQVKFGENLKKSTF